MKRKSHEGFCSLSIKSRSVWILSRNMLTAMLMANFSDICLFLYIFFVIFPFFRRSFISFDLMMTWDFHVFTTDAKRRNLAKRQKKYTFQIRDKKIDLLIIYNFFNNIWPWLGDVLERNHSSFSWYTTKLVPSGVSPIYLIFLLFLIQLNFLLSIFLLLTEHQRRSEGKRGTRTRRSFFKGGHEKIKRLKRPFVDTAIPNET